MAPVLINSFLWLEKESVEVDSELDKPGKPNWGSNHQLTARCHHCHGLGRTEECQESGSASSKSNNKSEREVHGEVEAHGQREVRGGRGELIELSRAKPGAGSASV